MNRSADKDERSHVRTARMNNHSWNWKWSWSMVRRPSPHVIRVKKPKLEGKIVKCHRNVPNFESFPPTVRVAPYYFFSTKTARYIFYIDFLHYTYLFIKYFINRQIHATSLLYRIAIRTKKYVANCIFSPKFWHKSIRLIKFQVAIVQKSSSTWKTVLKSIFHAENQL